jgi:hypothetical protein
MSDLERRLTAALHADEPPARDALFRVDVLLRLEQARFRRYVRRTMAAAALLAIVVAVNVPVLDTWMTADGSRLWLVALTAALATCVLSVAMVDRRVRTLAKAVGRLLYP